MTKYSGILVLFLFVFPGHSEDDIVAQKFRILKSQGESRIWDKQKTSWSKLLQDSKVTMGQTVKTGDNSVLEFSFEPAITVKVFSNTVVSMDKMLISHAQKAIRMRFNLQSGQCDVRMPADLGYNLLYSIITPNASLYINSADVNVYADENGGTKCEVLRGSAKIMHNTSEKKEIIYENNRAVIHPNNPEITITPLKEPEKKTVDATPKKPLTVAILSIESKVIPKENLEPLSDFIAQQIEKQATTDVLFLDDVRAMLRAEGKLNLLNCATDSCISKIGAYLGVDLVVLGKLGQLGNRFIFNLKIIDALRDVTKNRVSTVVDNDIGILFNEIPSLIDTLIKGQIEPEPVEDRPLMQDPIAKRQLYMEMVWLFPGTFQMGSSVSDKEIDELPKHTVTLNGFYIDKYETTRQEYERIMGYNPSKFKGCPTCPVDNVSWFEAQEYCTKTGKRLPTEAEWEYACRAGTETPFNYGKTLSSDQANFDGRKPFGGVPVSVYREKPLPVGNFKPNAWNLYDMHGNVWEWCNDWYDVAYYGNAAEKNPKGPKDGQYKAVRGGGWNSDGASVRSANRISYSPSVRLNTIGFRCVKD